MTTDKKARKEIPMYSGLLQYFPDAVAAVANVSYVGNQQHNPGQPMHWAREKSTDHHDCCVRHLTESGTIDEDGLRHSAKLAWRSLALLQLEIEDSRQSYDTIPLMEIPSIADLIGYTDALKGDPRRLYQTATEAAIVEGAADARVQTFLGMPIQYVPHLDGTYLLYSRPWHWENVYTMEFTEVEPEDTDPRTMALNEYLEAFDDRKPESKPHPHRQRLKDKLFYELGCIHSVAEQILGGTRLQNSTQYVYIAGPMRGYHEFNFPAFDTARDEFLQNGWNVISPADIDRAAGFTESVPDQPLDQKTFAYRDFYSLYLLAHLGNGAIAMLPGWEKSTGAVAEFFLARWLGLRVLDATTGQPIRAYDWYALNIYVKKFLTEQK